MYTCMTYLTTGSPPPLGVIFILPVKLNFKEQCLHVDLAECAIA